MEGPLGELSKVKVLVVRAAGASALHQQDRPHGGFFSRATERGEGPRPVQQRYC